MDEMVRHIAQLFARRIGVNIECIGEMSFEKIISDKTRELQINDYGEYYNRLTNSPQDFQDFVEQLIVPETWFFRNPSSFEFLQYYISQVLMPSLKEARPIRILSIACSSGEEPFSIAIQLLESGLKPQQFMIDGIDISQLALKKSDDGLYTKYSFRGINYDDPRLRTYFETQGDSYKIKNYASSCVSFHYGNILDESLLIYEYYYDIIFCKNLFIYMIPSAQEKLLFNINKLLLRKGVFIVSPVETALIKKAGYFSYPYPRSFAFQKKVFFGKLKKDKEVMKELLPRQGKIEATTNFIKEEENQLIKAKEYADSGKFEEAACICNKYLTVTGPNATAYFILGLIKHASDKDDEAEGYFLKTIYLEPKHYEALIYLALLSEKKEKLHKPIFFLIVHNAQKDK